MKDDPVKGPIRVDYVPLSILRRARRNPRNHDLGTLHESFSRFGFVQPILVRDTEDLYIVAGHGRLDTLLQQKKSGDKPPDRIVEKEGEWYIPVIRGVDFENEAEAEAYLITDNRTVELGGWDLAPLADLLQDQITLPKGLTGTGFDGDDLDDIIKRLPKTFPELTAGVDHSVMVRYKTEDEMLIAAFLGVDLPFNPLRLGKQILERIKAIAAARPDRQGQGNQAS